MTKPETEINDKYYQEVILRGDEASGSFKEACKEGNKFSLAKKYNILNRDGSIDIKDLPASFSQEITDVVETIDGVGTKVQIYCNQFENTFQSREKGEIDGNIAQNIATEIWFRMLMDLIAMNADDLRGGEVAIALTNIIDINHLNGTRGHLFQDSMSKAMKRAIEKTQIAMTAGETAVLGQSPEAKKITKITHQAIEEIQKLLTEDKNRGDGWGPSKITAPIQEIIDALERKITVVGHEIGFNIGGTALGLKTNREKLVRLEDNYYDIIAFEEQSKDGIIGPRANGITKIREDMEQIMSDGREDKTFENFIEKIGTEKAAKIPEAVIRICAGKKLWDIATGTTTVFNSFIANKLLGGLDGAPEAGIARLIHVTGNPLKKITEGVGDESYTIDLRLGTVTTPQIITLLQVALDIPDDQAMNKRNMGVPYVIVSYPSDHPEIASLAQEHGYKTQVIGSVTRKKEGEKDKKNTITGVGLGKSTIEF